MVNETERLNAFVERRVAGISSEEICAKRAEFFAKNGEVFHDDSFFEQRISFFHNQAVFGRFAGEKVFDDLGVDSFSLYHGLFRIIRFWGDYAKVRDLLGRKTVWVNCRSAKRGFDKRFLGFQKRDLIQGYLVKEGKHYALTTSIFIHPLDSYKHIRELVKTLPRGPKKDPVVVQGVLERLSRVQLLSQRQSTTKVGVFYSSAGAFGLRQDKTL